MKLLRWICFFSAISLASTSVVKPQTIADAARQERERRKAVESKTSVNIPIVISVTPAATAGSPATARVNTSTANEESKYTGSTDLQGHDEKYWRSKFNAARLAVKRAEDDVRLEDLRVNQTVQRRAGRHDPTILMRFGWPIIALQNARKALADAQQNLADLEDQLRRSGGLPGWSRPR